MSPIGKTVNPDGTAERQSLVDVNPEELGPIGKFQPHARYNEAGDQLEVRWKNVPEIAEYLNPQITLLKDRETGEVIGVEVINLKYMLRKLEEEMYPLKEVSGIEVLTVPCGIPKELLGDKESYPERVR